MNINLKISDNADYDIMLSLMEDRSKRNSKIIDEMTRSIDDCQTYWEIEVNYFNLISGCDDCWENNVLLFPSERISTKNYGNIHRNVIDIFTGKKI